MLSLESIVHCKLYSRIKMVKYWAGSFNGTQVALAGAIVDVYVVSSDKQGNCNDIVASFSDWWRNTASRKKDL